jgi:hypothetical protein
MAKKEKRKDMWKDMQRVITLFAILSFALGFAMVASSIFSIVTDSNSIYENIRLLSSLDLAFASIVAVILSVPFFFTGLGLWFLRGWAKTILTVLAALGIIYFVLSGLLLASALSDEGEMVTSDIIGAVIIAIGILLSVLIIWFFTRQSMILSFEAKEMKLTKRKIRALEEKIELGRQRCNAGEISKAELSKLRADCLAEERLLRARIRHFEKIRLSRERKIKDRIESKKKAKKVKEEKREKKRAEKEEEEEEEEEEEKPKKKAKKKKTEDEEKPKKKVKKSKKKVEEEEADS